MTEPCPRDLAIARDAEQLAKNLERLGCADSDFLSKLRGLAAFVEVRKGRGEGATGARGSAIRDKSYSRKRCGSIARRMNSGVFNERAALSLREWGPRSNSWPARRPSPQLVSVLNSEAARS